MAFINNAENATKRVAISKANAKIVASVAVASFVAIFCLVASKAVFSQVQYQARVTSAKNKADSQIKKNVEAFDSLVGSYKEFDGKSTNVIGGSRTGTGDNDGGNAKIILDSLPSSYDFPALASSLEKVFNDRNFKVTNITGTDDQVNQQSNVDSVNPEAVAIPFSFTVNNANYASIQQVVSTLQQSIRPIVVDTVAITGGANDMTINITAHTYYQPGKSIKTTTKVVK